MTLHLSFFLSLPRQQPGWPTHWQALTPFIGRNIQNTCLDCSDSIRDKCRTHQQSPIDLWRNVTATRDCNDRHRMHHKRGTCRFVDLRFEILPHVLRANQPVKPCPHAPVIDFSWGFPGKLFVREGSVHNKCPQF